MKTTAVLVDHEAEDMKTMDAICGWQLSERSADAHLRSSSPAECTPKIGKYRTYIYGHVVSLLSVDVFQYLTIHGVTFADYGSHNSTGRQS